ncbi:FecR family protein [Chitinophaga sedimenti]|nr:FecR domain-containing protein [Chitinophaga sedimenti]MCK7557471.1 FecR family protein [Chitinophaga sedimenti]
MNVGIPDRHILDRYLKNTCTEEERQLVDEWYEQLNIDVTSDSLISDADRAAVKAEVWEGAAMGMEPAGPRTVRRRIWWQAAVAAGIFGLIITSMNWWEFNEHRLPQLLAAVQTWDTVTAKAGKILHLTLDDGTKVWLKAGSTISYPQHFASSERTVALLNGEAFRKWRKIIKGLLRLLREIV